MKSIREAANIISQVADTSDQSDNNKNGFVSKVVSNIKGMLSDTHDSEYLSSKRVVAFLAFVCCVVAFFVDLFSNYNVSANLFDAMMWIVVAGLGFTGLEKFAPKK